MVLGFLFGKKEKENRRNELEEVRNRVLSTENALQQLSTYVQGEITKIYSYLHQLHTDIDGLASVVDNLKNGKGNDSAALAVLQQRLDSLERIADNLSIIGKVALRNHERISKLESRLNEMLLAIDRLVDEVIKSNMPVVEEKKKVELIEKVEREEEKKGEKKERKGRMSKEREYLAELARLRKELLELKTSS